MLSNLTKSVKRCQDWQTQNTIISYS